MTSEFSVNEKVALITGGASGIGLAIAKEFLKHGLRGVAIVDIDGETGGKALQELSKEFGDDRVIFMKTDVSKRQEVEAAFKEAVATFQNLDIVVNSVGICSGDEWERDHRQLGVKLKCGAAKESIRYLPKYKSGDEGVIVNISSVGGLGVVEAYPTYCATKHGIVGLSRCLGTENHYKRTKVRVLSICPGGTDTPMASNAKFMSPAYEELSKQVRLHHLPLQSTEKVGEGVVKAIREGQNGSVWVVKMGETYEVKLPDLFTLLEH